ncbi:2'-5' RNA ligase family protein [Brevibacillus invocatus]|uniref:2'-5' RNA ligase family protein n=1 Tax=Brevibacillus invocatus TaxID=173959 RepID=UPI00203CAB56|nr:2'-5' RNA ligase family protein [Brevibacillus invocatus]MCM3081839.1 2'-5' RNA ligase family protein [Brevibacillus invocatus]MCM3432246.1 2'-5' RNA ligase family protein [Brevibacillus invocatus]
MKRAIHLFPEFPQSELVQELRQKYDPLYAFIPPHITLVFPFKSEIATADLHLHVQTALADVQPFRIRLAEITATWDHHLFLLVKEGNDSIIDLHDKLYSGLLSIYKSRRHPFLPHLTVGRLVNDQEVEAALHHTRHFTSVFETTVSQVVAEVIQEDGASELEFVVPFPNQ